MTSIITILNYNESTYLRENPEVAEAVASGIIPNGYVENSDITLVVGIAL